MITPKITGDTASRFARLTLGHIGQEYPSMLQHVLAGPEDARTPSELHPIFYGSFDWHSCVHGWWQLLRLRRLFPNMPEAIEIAMRADVMLVPEKVAGELAYLARPTARGFERPYGWAWLLALHGEAARHDGSWAAALEPLARAFADRFKAHLPQLTYAIRSGAHFNTAFALVLAFDWARDHDPALADLIAERALGWFGRDRAAQAWEPSGDDFLSPTLAEALLMSRLLDGPGFARWLDAFLPEASVERPDTLFAPAHVSDRSDGKIAHLDGLNLSRAWCWRGIAVALGDEHPATPMAKAAAERHLTASLPHVEGDYMGEHWLATFALLALEQPISR
ncbi:DUF2891 domain-containing protein [Sphingomonas sp. CGMCC 1.13654]|uniref:DUF2891 domain-containing protein n=1 Tax=Sphingomonas chungangi TaxID=2683589 RepID=A0A838LAN4_9SPHN|nr:DUF2891 domain-containing protein [Sphingomonas chungangi]MBA2936264.1 DUF2891 domain-containing protein [Sphingomonas chungangi]MVW55649.1 DUF2891 family protein [Sphingomonas chungangi]